MKDFLTLPALELAGMLAAGELTSLELTQACLDRIHAVDRRVGAFLFVDDDGALAAARRVDAERAAGRPLHRLAGVPVAIKDNMVSRGQPTTCASKILEGWRPPYDATVVTRLREAGLPEPRFFDNGVSFTVLFPSSSLLPESDLAWLGSLGASGLSHRQSRALVDMRHGTVFTNSAYRARFGVSADEARADLADLVRRGLAERSGERRWVKYRLPSRL